jgi:hypothetical protein
MAEDTAADVVDPLAFVSRGDTGHTALEAPEPSFTGLLRPAICRTPAMTVLNLRFLPHVELTLLRQ